MRIQSKKLLREKDCTQSAERLEKSGRHRTSIRGSGDGAAKFLKQDAFSSHPKQKPILAAGLDRRLSYET